MIKVTCEAASMPRVFYSVPFVELHMLAPGQKTSAKTLAIRLERSPFNERMLRRMANAAYAEVESLAKPEFVDLCRA